MAAATPEAQAEALTNAYRQSQIRQASLIAALVALYYRQKVEIEDPNAVKAWVDLMLPRIVAGNRSVASLAAAYATTLRQIELPNAPKITFDPLTSAIEDAVKTSLYVTGPTAYLNKAKVIENLDVDPISKQAMLAEAKQVTSQNVAAAVTRHVQNGGRRTLAAVPDQDKTTLGYVRVTSSSPCFFCAMLASRGLVFGTDSFAASDPRFVGDGTAKVHDNCSCSLKAVYTKSDKFYQATLQYTDMWRRWGAGGGDAINNFRKGYTAFVKTGQLIDLADLAA